MHRFVVLSAILAVASAGRFSLINPHIVGGEETTIQEHPYQASLRRLGQHVCGAVIVSPKHILSSGFCLQKDVYDKQDDPKDYEVVVGSTHRSQGQIYGLVEIDLHPQFTWLNGQWALHFNVGVGTLAKPIVFSDVVQAIDLVPANQEPQTGDIVTMSGWGKAKDGKVAAEILHAVRIPIVDREECAKKLKPYPLSISEHMLCAGAVGHKETEGDYGGPLINDKNQLVGIASLEGLKDVFNNPSVYVNIADRQIRRFLIGIIRDL